MTPKSFNTKVIEQFNNLTLELIHNTYPFHTVNGFTKIFKVQLDYELTKFQQDQKTFKVQHP